MDSIYDQIGGMAAVSATVEELSARVVGDPRLAGIDMARRRRHMRALVATALGATHARPRQLADARAGLGISEPEFDRVAVHLAGALRTIGLRSDQIERILARIARPHEENAPAPV